MSYLLIYEINDYPDDGGGTQVEEFETSTAMTARASELLLQNTEDYKKYADVRGFRLKSSYSFAPIQVVERFIAVPRVRHRSKNFGPEPPEGDVKFATSRPKVGTGGTYKYHCTATNKSVVETFRVTGVEGDICYKTTMKDGEVREDQFAWRFPDMLNKLHDWPGKELPEDV